MIGSTRPRIGVVGAGVSGLTAAAVLADAGFKVTVIADSFEPSASAAAAAVWFPYAIPPEAEEWAHQSFDRLIEIAAVRGSGVSLVDFDVLSQNPALDIPEWPNATVRRRFRHRSACPTGQVFG